MQNIVNKSNLYMHNALSILAFVEAGYAVTILPALTRSNIETFTALPIVKLTMKRSLYILKGKSASLSPIDLRLIEVIRESVGRLALD